METVLFTKTLEPITVIDLPMWVCTALRQGQRVLLPVPVPYRAMLSSDSTVADLPEVVGIYGEVFRKGQYETMLVFTNDEVNALALRAAFLPGQRAEVQGREQRAFFGGAAAVLFQLPPPKRKGDRNDDDTPPNPER